MRVIGKCIAMTAADFEANADKVRESVADLCRRFPLYPEV
jgi:glycine hydroxymethyltransferase